jgi:hypothetical protein
MLKDTQNFQLDVKYVHPRANLPPVPPKLDIFLEHNLSYFICLFFCLYFVPVPVLLATLKCSYK